MDVVRDLLDKRVVDRNGREMGRVDGIVLHQDFNQQPQLTAILIGPSVLADRLHPRLGRIVRALEERFGVSRDRPTRIDFADIDVIDREVRVRLTISDTAVAAIEQRLRAWVSWLPGSR